MNEHQELERCRNLVEQRLGEYFTQDADYAVLLESMRYSLIGGGKRLRAVICLKFCEAVSGDMENAVNAACAVEMLHTYSLIHDDLPCMDDDDMRRGKPSNHIKYGECTAVLSGDALHSAAFELIAQSDLPPERVVEMIKIFAQSAGAHGICGGQYLDMFGPATTADALTKIHELKTAALFSAAARLGAIAGGGTPEQVTAAQQYAEALGFAFQVRDDVLDNTAFAVLLGEDECASLVCAQTEKAASAVSGKFENADFLIWLARMMAQRKS